LDRKTGALSFPLSCKHYNPNVGIAEKTNTVEKKKRKKNTEKRANWKNQWSNV